MSCEDLFVQQLRKRGFRLTPQREMVLRVLHQTGQPSTAEEIFALVAERSASVELSTVYRTLDLLVSMGMVTVIERSDKQHLFELSGPSTQHLHLVCRGCGAIIGLDFEAVQPLLEKIKAEMGFQAELTNLTIPGLCAGCAEEIRTAG